MGNSESAVSGGASATAAGGGAATPQQIVGTGSSSSATREISPLDSASLKRRIQAGVQHNMRILIKGERGAEEYIARP